MWSYVLAAPGRLVPVDTPAPAPTDLGDDELLLRFRAGGICGSDRPKFTGETPPSEADAVGPGFPLHELLADVVASTSPRFAPGTRVVGYARGAAGLREYLVSPAALVEPVPDGLTDLEAVVAQPLATVFNALDRAPSVAGRSAAVVGLGPLGLLFAYALKRRGARHVTGVDPVSRADVAGRYGIDTLVTATGREWVAGLGAHDRPDLCVEAVGHQTQTLDDAIRATAPGGHVIAFGVVDTEDYVVPFRTFFRKNLTLSAGTTRRWSRYLRQALDDLADRALDGYVSHVLPVDEAQRGYELAARPAVGRLKVVLTARHA